MYNFAVVYHYNPTSNRNIIVLPIGVSAVVYHYNPTSNRNMTIDETNMPKVVYHYNPTSNRNYISPVYSVLRSCISL